MEKIAPILRRNTLPKKMEEIPTTVGRLLEIENIYQRKIWGLKDIIKQDIIEQASTTPNKVGYLMSMVGIKKWAQKVDTERGLASGSTVFELTAITKRRNKIAHAADRVGSGRANLEPQETEKYLTQILSIADAIESILDK